MTSFHTKAEKKTRAKAVAIPGAETLHLNHMGGHSWDLSNPITALKLATASSFFGEPKYYQEETTKGRRSFLARKASVAPQNTRKYLQETLGAVSPSAWQDKTPMLVVEEAIDAALDFDARATLEAAGSLRNFWHIRTTPQVILVRAAHHPKVKGTGLIREYAPQILRRADEPAVGLAYHIFHYGKDKAIPNSLKRAWAQALEGFKEYDLAKYRMESRQEKTEDVVKLTHAHSPAIDKLMKGELSVADQTWEGIISTKGSSKATWTEAIDVMGHMALLRNVRNLLQKGVPADLFLEKLVAGAATGKQLPFRYWSAYRALSELGKDSKGVQKAIEQCMMTSLSNLPHFKGKVMALCDNSGSAQGATTSSMGTVRVSEIANLTAILTGLCADEGHIGVFGDAFHAASVSKKTSVFTQLEAANKVAMTIGQSTENGVWLFWDGAIREKHHWDHVFVYSDMQAGHGGLYGVGGYPNYVWPGANGAYNPVIDVPKLVAEYRKRVNPNVNVYLVQVAGYTDTIMPEFYDRTFVLGGWGEGILRFAKFMADTADEKGLLPA